MKRKKRRVHCSKNRDHRPSESTAIDVRRLQNAGGTVCRRAWVFRPRLVATPPGSCSPPRDDLTLKISSPADHRRARTRRRVPGQSQPARAHAPGLSPSAVSQWEADTWPLGAHLAQPLTFVGPMTLTRLLRYFGCYFDLFSRVFIIGTVPDSPV